LEEQTRRAADIQLRIADWITGFAGSMNLVYLHIALLTVWMLFIEKSSWPTSWPTLTLIVSLEAIFLSTFVMIGQNRQAAFQQAKADHDFTEQELELKTSTHLTREIHVLTSELHRRVIGTPPGRGHDGQQGKSAERVDLDARRRSRYPALDQRIFGGLERPLGGLMCSGFLLLVA
jgi:uncharacterized membrane protein